MSAKVRASELRSTPVVDGVLQAPPPMPPAVPPPVNRTGEEQARTHRARFRESLAWALDEYADTLAKLAK